MKTVLFALTLALAMPIGAQEPMTYARLCGATEGTGDNNDFCALWAQNNWQGMRNALSISIRTARAAENRNRFYFDHKRGAKRGAFIQLKRPWMGDDCLVRQFYRIFTHEGQTGVLALAIPQIDILIYCNIGGNYGARVQVVLTESAELPFAGLEAPSAGFDSLSISTGLESEANFFRNDALHARLTGGSVEARQRGIMPSDYVRRVVECRIDLLGWQLGEVEERPDCSQIESDYGY